jgi:hypothetical protein
LSPTQGSRPPQLQIDVQDAYKIGFGYSIYVRKEHEIEFVMALVPGLTKIGFEQNGQNNVNIQSPTCPGAIHIKTNAQVAYDIQLGHFWTPWKGKEISFTVELVQCPNSSEINSNY